MQVVYGKHGDLISWMKLVRSMAWNFPGLETEESLLEHEATVRKFIDKRQAICVKENGEVIAVLLFSRGHNMICCLAVSPEYRKKGLASALLTEALRQLDRTKLVTVSTFCEEDEKGAAPRALYKKFGFVEGEFKEEFGYPNQEFVLLPNGKDGGDH